MKSKIFYFQSMFPLAAGFLLLSVLLTGCYPNGDLTTSELDIVATNYDSEYFGSNSPVTYHMPDTIGVIGDGDKQLSDEMENFILAQVDRNFDNLGYERKTDLDPDDLPDVVVTVNAVVVKVTGTGCMPWYPWWGWYPWYPGWGWGGGYCYPTYLYSYETGTLTIDMISPEKSTNENFSIVWNAGVNGLTRSSQAGNQDFVKSTIDQAFSQSPYLKK